MDKKADIYEHNHCFKKHLKATKHNYITPAAICMRTLAGSSWCLDPCKTEGRNGE
jgi:hypothetical protein